MPEIVSDSTLLPGGDLPVEAPLSAANEFYSTKTNPGFGSFAAATLGEGPTAYLARAAERGTQEGSSWFDRAMSGLGQGIAGIFAQPEATATIPPEQYNERYAPRDAAGAIVPIGDQPMPEGLAKIIGEQKSQALARGGVLQRYAATHGGLTTFGAGTAASMLDPINIASLFIPGVGEDMIAARLGGGFAARAAARVAAGAATGTLYAAPTTGLRLALDPEEAGDYSMWDALRDTAYSAAGVAAFHSGLGTSLDLLRGGMRAPPTGAPVPPAALDAATQNAAMRSSVAQVVEGRPVDTTPVLQSRVPEAETRGFTTSSGQHAGNEITEMRGPVAPGPGEIPQVDTLTPAQREQANLAEGWAPGISRDRLAASTEEVYGKPETATPSVSRETSPTAPTPEEALLEQHVAQLPPEAIHPEDQAALTQAAEGMTEAQTLGEALSSAAACLRGL